MDISSERRNGYAWYNADGVDVLARYADWSSARTAKGSPRSQE